VSYAGWWTDEWSRAPREGSSENREVRSFSAFPLPAARREATAQTVSSAYLDSVRLAKRKNDFVGVADLAWMSEDGFV
jgi:hypothetical protein